MIEIAPSEYERSLAYDDAILYCFSLSIDGKVGWRLPNISELRALGLSEISGFWFSDVQESIIELFRDTEFQVVPVRLKDD